MDSRSEVDLFNDLICISDTSILTLIQIEFLYRHIPALRVKESLPADASIKQNFMHYYVKHADAMFKPEQPRHHVAIQWQHRFPLCDSSR